MSTRLGGHAVTVLLMVVALAAITLTLTTPALPQTEAQTINPPRTVTVYVTRTVYASAVRTMYLPTTVSMFLYNTVVQTLQPFFSTVSVTVSTFTNASTTMVVTVTETSHASSQVTFTSLVSGMVTKTATATAPFHIGPYSLDLADAGGLKFLAFTGAVALAGFIVGILVSRIGTHPKYPPFGGRGM